MENLHENFSIKTELKNSIWMFLAILIPVFYACMVSFRGMPPSEGWYQYWTYLMNEHGLAPYRDFNFLFSPFYLNFIALFAKIFGYGIICYRILGIFIFAVITIGLFLVFELLFGKEISFVCTVVATLYLQSEVAQIFYDYVRVMDCLAIFSIYYLLRSLKARLSNSLFLFLNGLFCALFIITKQNSGIIFFTFDIVAIVFSMFYLRKSIPTFIKNLGLVFLPVFFVLCCLMIYLWSIDSLTIFFGATTGDAAAAKGGLKVILFNWIINGLNAVKSNITMSFSVLFFWALVLIGIKSFGQSNNVKSRFSSAPYFIFFAVVFVSLLGFCINESFASILKDKYIISPYLYFDIVFPLFTILTVVFIYKLFQKSEHSVNFWYLIFATSGSYFAISYGCGTSGGLAEGQAYLGVGIAIGLTLFLIGQLSDNEKSMVMIKRSSTVFVICLAALFALAPADRKMHFLYHWWGSQESSFWKSTEKTEKIPLLRGVKFSKETKKFYEDIYDIVTSETSEDDCIYCFPMIPYFYNMLNRKDPGVYNKVEWFDMTSSEARIKNDIAVLKANPPKAIIIFNVPEFAYQGHENGFYNGRKSSTRVLRDFLLNLAKTEKYQNHGKINSEFNSVMILIKNKQE